MTGSARISAVAGSLGPVGIGNISVVAVVCLVFECMGCSAEGTEHFAVVGLANHHPSPLLYFYKMEQFGPHFSFICFGATAAWGIAASWGYASTFIVGLDVGVGRNWPVLS